MKPKAPPHEKYQPTSRRPIADAFRRTAHISVRLCVKWHIHPDAISYSSMVAAALAGLCLFYSARHAGLLLLAPFFCYLRLWLNMLDGMVALASGKASLRGEILNDLPDRVSDILIFAGLAHSGLCQMVLAYWAILGALLTAYVGTFGQAVAGRREFGGIMSKPWRMVVLHLGAWASWAILHFGGSIQWGPLTLFDWTCAIVFLGCLQTIWVRLGSTLALLKSRVK